MTRPSEAAIEVAFYAVYGRKGGPPTDERDGPELCSILNALEAAYAVDWGAGSLPPTDDVNRARSLLRCLITQNQCGTDTRPGDGFGKLIPCPCGNCTAWELLTYRGAGSLPRDEAPPDDDRSGFACPECKHQSVTAPLDFCDYPGCGWRGRIGRGKTHAE